MNKSNNFKIEFEVELQDGTTLTSGSNCKTKTNNEKLTSFKYNKDTNECLCKNKQNDDVIHHINMLEGYSNGSVYKIELK